MIILGTGSFGFLGQSIQKVLANSHEIYTLGLNIQSSIQIDLLKSFQLPTSFDVVIHAAGKAHSVPKTPAEAIAFWDVNVIGTQNLLKALEEHPPQRFVFISSVAVYGKSQGHLLNEQAPVLAVDPYGQSKIQAEAEIIDWCRRFDVTCTILRLPLIYGENPPGNLKAMIQGIKKGYYFNIAGGQARKSMVRAEDVARFILPASEVGGIYHLTDGQHPNFFELSHKIGKAFGRNRIPNMPLGIAKVIAKIGDVLGPWFPLNSDKLSKITSELTFDDSLARQNFGWDPKPVLAD
ncbi:MAG: hypothetical protein RL638_229 [Bacteroidota bacterium]